MFFAVRLILNAEGQEEHQILRFYTRTERARFLECEDGKAITQEEKNALSIVSNWAQQKSAEAGCFYFTARYLA